MSAVTFYGKWSLDVTQAAGVFFNRFQIVGSVASDRIVPITVGTQVAAIDGDSWDVVPEFSDDNVTWTPDDVERFPSVTPQDGLIVTLVANQFAVRFVYLNPQANPPGPAQPPYSYTLPPGQFWPQPPPPPVGPSCCECTCCHNKASKRVCCR
jgi:hypothetical protein